MPLEDRVVHSVGVCKCLEPVEGGSDTPMLCDQRDDDRVAERPRDHSEVHVGEIHRPVLGVGRSTYAVAVTQTRAPPLGASIIRPHDCTAASARPEQQVGSTSLTIRSLRVPPTTNWHLLLEARSVRASDTYRADVR